MPKQRRSLGQAQLALRGALDQSEQRTKFLFRREQRCIAWPQNAVARPDTDRRFAPFGIGHQAAAPTVAIAPELSSCSV